MRKKGFTLIELLAVIVILAIAALIAIPIILNVIDKAKEGAAKASVYRYVEAVENYQATAALNSNIFLKEVKYNIEKRTIINEQEYEKLNNIIKIKGTKPTSGTVDINSKGQVLNARICINNYLIDYISNKAETISNDCSEMGLFVEYSISETNWAFSKELKISYPQGNYKHFYKLENGKASYNGETIEVGKEIETEKDEVTIKLEENSKITAWVLKNNKEIGKLSYIEDKIDTEQLFAPTIDVADSYSTLSNYGIFDATQLKITNEKNPTAEIYYSTDDGNNWIKYDGITSITSDKVIAKIKKENGREYDVTSKTISNDGSKTLGTAAYDGDTNTYVRGQKYIYLDDSIIGKKIRIYWSQWGSGDTAKLYVEDSNHKSINSYQSTNIRGWDKLEITIPEGAKYLNFALSGQGSLAEIAILD